MATTYTYFIEQDMEEHMLFAKEIGEIVGLSSRMVSARIDKYCKEKNVILQKFYYKTKYGLARVYPEMIWKLTFDHIL